VPDAHKIEREKSRMLRLRRACPCVFLVPPTEHSFFSSTRHVLKFTTLVLYTYKKKLAELKSTTSAERPQCDAAAPTTSATYLAGVCRLRRSSHTPCAATYTVLQLDPCRWHTALSFLLSPLSTDILLPAWLSVFGTW